MLHGGADRAAVACEQDVSGQENLCRARARACHGQSSATYKALSWSWKGTAAEQTAQIHSQSNEHNEHCRI